MRMFCCMQRLPDPARLLPTTPICLLQVERTVHCQASLYQSALMAMVTRAAAPDSNQKMKHINNAVMELRTICNHPMLSQLHQAGTELALADSALPAVVRLCGKLEALDRLLTRLIPAGHRVSPSQIQLHVLEECLHPSRLLTAEGKPPVESLLSLDQVAGGACKSQAFQQWPSSIISARANVLVLWAASLHISAALPPCHSHSATCPQDSKHVKRCSGICQVLIFSTMTRALDIIEEYLDWGGLEYVRLDGSTASADRGSIVQDFNAPGSTVSIFLLSVRAGGVGLNLQTADTVIMYDTGEPVLGP